MSGVTSAIQTQLNTCAKLSGAIFTGAITVNGNTPLYSLPTTANFTTLNIGNNAVATQAWVTGNAYLTSLPRTANFTTLTVGNNAVATQAWVTGNGYLTSIPSTVALLAGAAFTGAIIVNGNTPLYSLPTTANFTTHYW